MEQASITSFYNVRTHKRKFGPDGEDISRKVILIERDGRTTPDAQLKAAPAEVGLSGKKLVPCNVPRRCVRAVAKLSFEGDGDGDGRASKTVPFRKCGALSPMKAKPEDVRDVGAARRELSLGDVKRVLSKSTRREELKAKMASLNEGFKKLEQLQRTPEKTLKQFESIDLLVPSSPVKGSPSKCGSSPIKRLTLLSPIKSPAKVPAYLRHESLAVSSEKLPMPHHYRFLGEVFRAVDTVCSMLTNRRETITFEKIKPSVQEILKRNVTLKNLAQIKYLCPQMYEFSCDKVKTFSVAAKKDEYQLVMTPNVVDRITGSPTTSMTPDSLLERRRAFYNLLIEAIKIEHEKFLAGLDPPMVIPREKLTRWHPEFDLERIPDVECAILPEPPNVERLATAQDMLSKAKEMYCTPRLQRALERLAESKLQNPEDDPPSGSAPEVTLVNPALKKIPSSLLEKVRARQAEKALKEMTRSTQQEENLLIYQRLPEMARHVRNVFAVEKKNVLHIEFLISKLEYSLRVKMSNPEILKYLKLLAKEVPKWIIIYSVRKFDFVKLDKSIDLARVTTVLEALAQKFNV